MSKPRTYEQYMDALEQEIPRINDMLWQWDRTIKETPIGFIGMNDLSSGYDLSQRLKEIFDKAQSLVGNNPCRVEFVREPHRNGGEFYFVESVKL